MLVDAKRSEVARERNHVWCELAAVTEALDMHPSVEWAWWLDSSCLPT
jgi:hypothetical protein